MKKLLISIIFITLGLFLPVSESWSQLQTCDPTNPPDPVPVERDSTYTINSDASFTYTAEYTFYNNCDITLPVVRGFSVLFSGATVTTNNFDSSTFTGEGTDNEVYGTDFPLGYKDLQEVALPINVTYDADGYTFTGHIDSGETKTFTISYSGPVGVWSQKSINPAFPWTDQYGWWELIGDGHAGGFDNFKVTVNLPSNTAQYKVMGYDPLDLGYPLISGNQIIFFSSNSGGKLDEDILFQSPLPVATSGFVIGDGNAAVGQKVTFWGAQWSKLNTLSGGSAPASFKGFENMPAAIELCGGTWSTDPGNSSNPPDSIPDYIAVIVSSSVTKKGPAISGDVSKLVVVKTDPGYAPNPGHAGTGTVVAVICP